MIPLLAYGTVAAAAFILTACGKETETEAPPTPKKIPRTPPKPAPKPLGSTKPAAAHPSATPPKQPAPEPFASIEETLKGHPRALEAYRLLKQAETTDEQIDQGCHEAKEIQGARDRKIVPCEVYEFSLDHYQGHLLAARKVAGGNLPWNLFNSNPSTPEKNSLKKNTFEKKLDETLGQLKNSKGLKELDSKSPEYKKRLARALFYFVNFPKNPAKAKALKKTWQERTRELTFLGMRDYQAFLFQNGGLGAFDFANRPGMGDVGGAFEALEKNRGGDISKSNILYAVFKKAGLNPFFSKVQMEFANPQAEIEIAKSKRATKYSDEYVVIGIPWKDSALIFHPDAMWELDTDTPHEPFKSLRIYLAAYQYTLGAFYLFYTDQHDEMISHFRDSIELSPGYAAPYNGLGHAFKNMKKLDEAEKAFLEGLRRKPHDFFLNWNYGDFLQTQRKAPPEKVLRYFYRAALDKTFKYYNAQDRNQARQIANRVLATNPGNGMAQDILKILRGEQVSERIP